MAPAPKRAKMFLDQEKRSPTRCSYYEARLWHSSTIRRRRARQVWGLSGLMTYVELMLLRSSRHVRLRERGQGWTDSQDHLADGQAASRCPTLISLRRTEGCGTPRVPVVCVSPKRWRVERSRSGAVRLRCSGIWRGFHDAGVTNSYLLPTELRWASCRAVRLRPRPLRMPPRWRRFKQEAQLQQVTPAADHLLGKAELIVHSEFRDGNPAGPQFATGVQKVCGYGGVPARLRYCAEGRDPPSG